MFVDVNDLQNQIIEHPDHIATILEALGHAGIKDRGKYYQCINLDGDNPSGISVLKSNLKYQNFSHGESGNLFTLVSDEKNISFPNALKWISNVLGLSVKGLENINIKPPFGGFFKNIIRQQQHPEDSMAIYSEKMLPNPGILSQKWLLDGVDLQTQEAWGIRLDFDTNAIIVPWYNLSGDLIGAKSRSNDPNCPMDKRWYAYLPFAKTHCCYGMLQNYKEIIRSDTIIIVEAEKSVLQAYSFGIKNCIAIGGHSISETQARLIKSLMVSNVIVAFDEGISDDESEYECRKLINNFAKNKVGYIKDDEGDVRIMGSKNSPTDDGEEPFRRLLKEYVVWL